MDRNLTTVRLLKELLQLSMDNGAERIVMPSEYKRRFLGVNAELPESVDSIYYDNVWQAAIRTLGLV